MCLYEGAIIVPTTLYGEACGMRSAEKKVNVVEMKCLRSLVLVSGIY